ncbi:MAG: AMP-binding protein [Mycobacterium sp.]|nr:AMP-binding protein [Mycobacterium sp.]
MTQSSLIGVLRERASLQPDDLAYTYMDYDLAPEGVANSLTWAQLARKVHSLAWELRQLAQIGDRAVIVAPQGLEYVIAFLATLQAGIVGVPLSVPQAGKGGRHDERIAAVIEDSAPTILLTTAAVTESLTGYAVAHGDRPALVIVEVDSLDLDERRKNLKSREEFPEVAYLQYTSGSTRTPAGVMVSDANLPANFEHFVHDVFDGFGNVAPPGTTAVLWLPFYHDMGLVIGIVYPILGGWHTVFTTPASFVNRPSRWVQLMAGYPNVLTAGPNFAFELSAAKTTDEDMAGLDLGNVIAMVSGAERVHDATLRRFARRFAKFNFHPEVYKPSYGLAEATLFITTRAAGGPPTVAAFDPDKLSAGKAERCSLEEGTALVSYGTETSPLVRIVDPETRVECPAGIIGEIWSNGENNCLGYWRKPEQTERLFQATIVNPTEGTPEGPWLRTGDLGVISDGDLFIIGRIKDLLIVRGRNHYPDDIEATITEITGGRVAAFSVEEGRAEQLVAIIEIKNRDGRFDGADSLETVKRDVATAVSETHGISAADLVLVSSGAVPLTTSGKVRRSSCAEQYRKGQFNRLDEKAQTA